MLPSSIWLLILSAVALLYVADGAVRLFRGHAARGAPAGDVLLVLVMAMLVSMQSADSAVVKGTIIAAFAAGAAMRWLATTRARGATPP